jgi:hypothetical protein
LSTVRDAWRQVSSWLGAQVELVRHGVELRGELSLGASLAVRARLEGESLSLEAELPDGPPLRLTPQRGLKGLWESRNELVLGNDELDDAYVIRGDASARDAALLAADRLTKMAAVCDRIELDAGRLSIVMSNVGADVTARALDDALHAWRSIALSRVEATS